MWCLDGQSLSFLAEIFTDFIEIFIDFGIPDISFNDAVCFSLNADQAQACFFYGDINMNLWYRHYFECTWQGPVVFTLMLLLTV